MSLRTLASTLGLSLATVSLALRNHPRIPAATRARVRAAAAAAGYRPDARLRELMGRIRVRGRGPEACFGVVSLYEEARPWERSRHLNRIFDAMARRADELGYRLEPLWLREPGMTFRRIRGILDTRGIQGLLSFGSPNLGDPFPRELDHYAVVTVGLSIATPLHRVTSHFYSDLTRTLTRLRELGYRRPGLVLGNYEERRSAHAYSSAYFGWCEQAFGRPEIMPILRLNDIEGDRLAAWRREHQPDVVVLVHLYPMIAPFLEALAAQGVRYPKALGVAAVTQLLEGTGVSGMQQNQDLMGAWAVELLVARILNQDFGIPTAPRIEMVESRWIEGMTLTRRP